MSGGGRDGYSSEDERDIESIKSDLANSADSVESQLSISHLYGSAQSSAHSIGRPSVRDFVASIENLSTDKPTLSSTMGVTEDLKPLKVSRASYRGKITQQLNLLKAKSDAGTLNEVL